MGWKEKKSGGGNQYLLTKKKVPSHSDTLIYVIRINFHFKVEGRKEYKMEIDFLHSLR